MNRKQLIEKAIEEHSLCCTSVINKLVKQKGDYFIRANWGNGSHDSMGTKKEVIEIICDKMSRNYDDAYDLEIVNIKTGKAVTWKAKTTVELIEQS